MFEFPDACAGCGETPYLKLLSQLFGDRLLIANATGCSSIHGGNLPTTPLTTNADGRGPAWSNSLFEDNAEFGLGFRLAADTHTEQARRLLTGNRESLGAELVDDILGAPQRQESDWPPSARVSSNSRNDWTGWTALWPTNCAVCSTIWSVAACGSSAATAGPTTSGPVGWTMSWPRAQRQRAAVLDTEVYSNTGGQMSKSTPLGAVAKFAAGGKTVPRKDLALQAIAYGNVYAGHVAWGRRPLQTLQAFRAGRGL